VLGLSHKLAVSSKKTAAAAAAAAEFTFTVNTANAGVSTSTQFQLPLVSSGAISMDVDWGDSTSDTITTYNQAETLHTYSVSGTYTIAITNEVRGWKFDGAGDDEKILDISKWGEFNFTNNRSFRACSILTCSATDIPTISSADISWSFNSCYGFNGIMDGWNVSSVTNMMGLFGNMPVFDQDLSSWDIDQVTNFNYFLSNSTLSTTNYDALLISWEAQAPNSGLSPNFGSSTYTGGGTAATARASLISTYGWTITDGGIA
jgi:hypothetical protein